MVVIVIWRIRVTRPLSINMLAGYKERAILAYTVPFYVKEQAILGRISAR
jgi:hypothetical protein